MVSNKNARGIAIRLIVFFHVRRSLRPSGRLQTSISISGWNLWIRTLDLIYLSFDSRCPLCWPLSGRIQVLLGVCWSARKGIPALSSRTMQARRAGLSPSWRFPINGRNQGNEFLLWADILVNISVLESISPNYPVYVTCVRINIFSYCRGFWTSKTAPATMLSLTTSAPSSPRRTSRSRHLSSPAPPSPESRTLRSHARKRRQGMLPFK